MIQELLYLEDENTERCFSNPPVILKENKRSPLLGYAGAVPVRNLIERLDIVSVLDSNISVLKRHKPYFESDHVLNFVYNFLTGGEVINGIERLQEAEGILRILGTGRIPDPTTAGDFLVRFTESDIKTFQDSLDQIQDTAFSLLDRKRKETAQPSSTTPRSTRCTDRRKKGLIILTRTPTATRSNMSRWQRPAMYCTRNCGRVTATAVLAYRRSCPGFSIG